jgi:hypothetical protein
LSTQPSPTSIVSPFFSSISYDSIMCHFDSSSRVASHHVLLIFHCKYRDRNRVRKQSN